MIGHASALTSFSTCCPAAATILGAAHPAALGLEGDEAAVFGAPQGEDHLQAPGAVLGHQALQPEAAARQHLRPHIRPRQRCPHHLQPER